MTEGEPNITPDFGSRYETGDLIDDQFLKYIQDNGKKIFDDLNDLSKKKRISEPQALEMIIKAMSPFDEDNEEAIGQVDPNFSFTYFTRDSDPETSYTTDEKAKGAIPWYAAWRDFLFEIKAIDKGNKTLEIAEVIPEKTESRLRNAVQRCLGKALGWVPRDFSDNKAREKMKREYEDNVNFLFGVWQSMIESN